MIVANRLAVRRVRRNEELVWETSPGGLVTALKPILEKRPSTWVGWAGEVGSAPEPFTHEGIHNLPVPLSQDELETFYQGFANRTLWPLYHDAIRPPEYRRRWWQPYVQVNRRFAEAAAAIVADNGMVWVHDYHLQLVPGILRELRPDLRIGFFLHIPFPPSELFSQLPWRRQVLEGLLGADLVGFQTTMGAQNFSRLAKRYTSASGRRDAMQYENRIVHAGAFPVSIDVEHFEKLAQCEEVKQQAESYQKRLGENRRVILGVDRLDYTKGIDIRLRAFHELLKAKKVSSADTVFVQVAVPSREQVIEYQQLRQNVERLVGEINGEFGELGQAPIHYLHRSFPRDELVALYMAAQVMVVTPLRDGMNLIAKEYVSTRLDDTGVLLLSEFTGSAREMRDALLVNPHDIDGLANKIYTALHLSESEQKRRMKALRKTIKANDVFHWANSFLDVLTA